MIIGAASAVNRPPAGLTVALTGSCAAIICNVMIMLLLLTWFGRRPVTGGYCTFALGFATVIFGVETKRKDN